MSIVAEDMKIKLIAATDSDIDEVEIKIEYNESTEADPLRENYPNLVNSTEIINFRTDIHSTVTTTLPTGEENLCAAQNTFQNTNNECEYDGSNDKIENEGMNADVSWHKCIDDSERLMCKFCDLKYSSTQTLRHHVKTKHPEEAKGLMRELVKSKRNKRLKCHICDKYFKEITYLKDHVQRSHNLIENFQICAQNVASEHLYLKQNNVMNSKAIYLCNVCGYHTRSKSHYNQHVNTHVSDKSMKCQHCDYATNHVHNLKVHERKHTNYKPYVCNFNNCGYKCSSKSALRSHQSKHSPEENMLYCDKCGYRTIYKQCLKRHIDSHSRNSIRLKLL